MVAGVKERFIAYKLGVAFCDFNHDRVVEFEGFDGFVNFAREVDASINSPVWKAVRQRTLEPAGEKPAYAEKHLPQILKRSEQLETMKTTEQGMSRKPEMLRKTSLQAAQDSGVESPV